MVIYRAGLQGRLHVNEEAASFLFCSLSDVYSFPELNFEKNRDVIYRGWTTALPRNVPAAWQAGYEVAAVPV
jgi:hypothetical protein